MVVLILAVVAWVAIGVALGWADARLGRRSARSLVKSWAVGAVLGPAALPLAIVVADVNTTPQPAP
jgi:hypothetical protein